MFGIAKMNERVPLHDQRCGLDHIFDLTVPILPEGIPPAFKKEKYLCCYRRYLPEVQHLNKTYNVLRGMMQVYKYFDSFKDDVFRQFTFRKDIRESASAFLHEAKQKAVAAGALRFNPVTAEVVFVGVHVRRGDYIRLAQKRKAVLAGKEYLDKAMRYFQEKYRNVLFVVASNDIPWCTKNVDSRNHSVVFSLHQIAPVDLAILSQCNHTIFTQGTFGWWAAYLAGGDAVYFKDWVVRNITKNPELEFDPNDYFPRHWIGLEPSGTERIPMNLKARNFIKLTKIGTSFKFRWENNTNSVKFMPNGPQYNIFKKVWS